MLFCNEMLGLGHLRLSLVLAEALVAGDERAAALVVTGSPAFGGMRLPPRVDIVKLPTAPVGADSRWSATDRQPTAGLSIGDGEVAALRAELSLAVVDRFRPDVVVVDYRPLGREADLAPALDRLRARGDCTTALGLWDVDDSPERLRAQWTPELARTVADLYDLAVVYGPSAPDDVRIERLRAAAVPVYNTGLVGPQPGRHPTPDLGEGYLLATTGGGVDGFEVLDALLAAIRVPPIEVPVVVVTGPLMDPGSVARLRDQASGLPVRVLEFRTDMDAVIAGARAIVAMAGYCTVAEVLGSGKPALLVPRVFPREEQLNRARRLAAEGRVAMLLPDELDPIALARAIGELLERPPTTGEPLTGATDAARILADSARPDAS